METRFIRMALAHACYTAHGDADISTTSTVEK